jgi:hypothetical protein
VDNPRQFSQCGHPGLDYPAFLKRERSDA